MMSVETAFQQLREANPVPDPALLIDASTDLAGLLATTTQRSAEMQTEELTRPKSPQQRTDRPWLLAASAAAAVLVIGAVIAISTLGGSPDVAENPPVTTTSPAPLTPSIDASAAAPTQVLNDQGSRATIEFAGNAQGLVAGGAHIMDIQMEIEADTNSPAITVHLVSTDGEVTTTGVTSEGDTFTPTWAWTPDGNKVVITMVGRGVSIPDTRPSVVVSIQEAGSSEPIEFVLTAEAGSGSQG
jgi:hypothetical protein